MSEAKGEQASKALDPLLGASLEEKYRVDSLIGVGGMGSVYRARQVGLERDVAVKVLHEFFSCDPQSVQRFRQEAEALKRLSHARIVALYGFGLDSVERPYIVMELVKGKTLKSVLAERGPLPPATVRTILLQVLSALEHAHAQNLVHRDLKPDNIFLCCADGADPLSDPDVKLLDFGIARLLDAGSQKLTKTGVLLGTPLYMSPEVCSAQPALPQSDIYSLGCIAFECLTGQPPFTGDTLLAVAYAHCNDLPPAMSTPGRSVPSDLESIVLKAIAKDPAQRFASTAEFVRAVKELRTIEVPVDKRKNKPGARAYTWPIKIGGGVSAVAACALLALGLSNAHRSEQIHDLCSEAENIRLSERRIHGQEQTPRMPEISQRLMEASKLSESKADRARVLNAMHAVVQDYRALGRHMDKAQGGAEVNALKALCIEELSLLGNGQDSDSLQEKLRVYNVLMRLASLDPVNAPSYAAYAQQGLDIIGSHREQMESDEAIALLRATSGFVHALQYSEPGLGYAPQVALPLLKRQEELFANHLMPHFEKKDLVKTRLAIDAIEKTGKPPHLSEIRRVLEGMSKAGQLPSNTK